MRKYLYLLFFLFNIEYIVAEENIDNNNWGWFVPVKFSKPFVAEMESPLSKVEVGYGRAFEEYTPLENSGKEYYPYLNVSLGAYLPVWSKKLQNNWYIGIDFPIHFHLWLDMKTESAPVINTDYRFAVGEIKALKVFPENKYLKNISFRLAPYNHESTHIGDELSIRREINNYPITRVNVSYEYTEFNVCLNDAVEQRITNHSFKAGIMMRVPTSKSWFKIYPNEGDTIFNHKMRNITEYYFQYEWQRAHGWGAKPDILNVLSFEARNRARYSYPSIVWDDKSKTWYTSVSEQSRAWGFNLYYGWKFFPKPRWLYNSVGFYAHAYFGIVPFGQFRNLTNYSYFGISIVIEQ